MPLQFFLDHLARSKPVPEIVQGAHVVSLPSLTVNQGTGFYSEDRYVVEKWTLFNESWTFIAVLDGHGGTAAADFVLNELPTALKNSIGATRPLADEEIARILSREILALDDQISDGFTSLFPDDLSQVSVDDAARAFKDPSADSGLRTEVLRAISGTAVAVALIDPSNVVHVASVGDCDVFVCAAEGSPTGWEVHSLGPRHRCTNSTEAARIRAEHPGEEFCVTNLVPNGNVSGVLGHLTVSRGPNKLEPALGDMPFKLSPDHIRLLRSVRWYSALEDRVLTPPYLSNVPDIHHFRFAASKRSQYLVLSSDGFAGLFKRAHGITEPKELASVCASIASSAEAKGENMAVSLLWEAFGGENEHNIFKELAEGTPRRGSVDDITVVVVPIL
ncbi:hypothetical protein D9757_011831 [Collybiopsis confluens]|uniref:PPM-type phosphatase domain-containing protein n=1 Tax=Collybiopsis confluens TaxID=2823264 RepID=A0A8H5H0E6_9AGAR|nr:hypothetical protein D9757_011831 [Collybiopsis confluens]